MLRIISTLLVGAGPWALQAAPSEEKPQEVRPQEKKEDLQITEQVGDLVPLEEVGSIVDRLENVGIEMLMRRIQELEEANKNAIKVANEALERGREFVRQRNEAQDEVEKLRLEIQDFIPKYDEFSKLIVERTKELEEAVGDREKLRAKNKSLLQQLQEARNRIAFLEGQQVVPCVKNLFSTTRMEEE